MKSNNLAGLTSRIQQFARRVLKRRYRHRLKNIRRILGYVTGYWQLKAIVALIVITTIMDVLTPAIIGGIIDILKDVAAGREIQPGIGVERVSYNILTPVANWFSSVSGFKINAATLFVFSFSLVVISSFTGLLNYLIRFASTIVSQKASFKMREEMYNSLLEQSFSFYDKQRTGQLMARATGDINMLERFYNFGLRMILSSSFLAVLVVYSLISLNLELTLISVIVLPFVLYVTANYSKKISSLWREVREQYGVITSVIQEYISGIRVVRGFSRESYEEEKFYDECNSYFNINVDMARIRSFLVPLSSYISSLGFVIILWYGGRQVISGDLSLGNMVSFYFYLAQLMGPVRMIGFMTSMFVRASTASARVFEVIDAEVEVSDKEDAEELKTVEGKVTFDEVWFSYDGENMVLKNISFDVKQGETIAILGATGSGKSSIINLIPRFYDVSEGSIEIDGVDIRDVTIKSLRKNIGIVRQDPFIFSNTLMGNIAYGVKDAKLDDVVKAAKRAKIHEFIESLPEGYDTKIGERGVNLSGGQKQRVSIARALLKNPKILILDDSTSSVDTDTEYEIQQALEDLLEDRTTFIITQRLSSIRKADKIVVLEEGRIVEEGRHEELIKRDGVYKILYETQISGVVERREA